MQTKLNIQDLMYLLGKDLSSTKNWNRKAPKRPDPNTAMYPITASSDIQTWNVSENRKLKALAIIISFNQNHTCSSHDIWKDRCQQKGKCNLQVYVDKIKNELYAVVIQGEEF